MCTEIIDAKGLGVTGIYRVPGNNASITALSEEINRNFDELPLEDARWNDLHVVSSLLKAFLRKMPDSLVTSALYPHFIKVRLSFCQRVNVSTSICELVDIGRDMMHLSTVNLIMTM